MESRRMIFRVQKEYKIDGMFDYDVLFEGTKEEAEKYIIDNNLKDTKKTKYAIRGFKTITITKKEQEEAIALNRVIINNLEF